MSGGQDYLERNKKTRIQHSQKVKAFLLCYDIIAVSFSFFVALWLRFDLTFSLIPDQYLNAWRSFAPVYALLCIIVFYLFHLYNSVWRFASFKELQRITLATGFTCLLHIILITFLFRRMPMSYYIMGPIIQYVLIVGIRFSYRFYLLLKAKQGTPDKNGASLLIGAGEAGALVLRELLRTESVGDRVVAIIDDNPNKWGRDIEGVPIIGGREKIIETVNKNSIKKIYIAIPSVSGKEKKEILDICKETDCELKTLPGLYQLMRGDITVNSFRNVDVEDLLGREPIEMGSKELQEYVVDKTVLITGGGGSIGSELCHQVAAVKGLKRLIVFDIYENNAHAIMLELTDKYPDLDLVVLIGSVRDGKKVKQVFAEYKPDIVFHAAAHKHVPLMEGSPCEAIKNNVLGTYNVAYAAMVYGCEKFVLISTDKAVNPVNIMGASKRICEMIVQTFAKKIEEGKASELPDLYAEIEMNDNAAERVVIAAKPKTEFVAVRFGNVLGSNGSVIPRFREQIAAGGPVTVTHPDIIRYFMTIPEAASLVLTAATFGGGGKIFVLDMGTAVKIDDLARNMIRLSGLKPDEDIRIIYTGLRPGEKLYEERLLNEEGLTTTSNELISVGRRLEFDEDAFLMQLKGLIIEAYDDREDIRELLAQIVPTYHPAGEHGTEEISFAYVKQCRGMEKKIV